MKLRPIDLNEEPTQYLKVANKYERAAKRLATKHREGRTKKPGRYHVLDLRDPQYGYKGGWLDRDALMMLAAFRVFCDFVEYELYNPRNVQTAWGTNEELAEAKQNIDLAYLYWKRDRPALQDKLERDLAKGAKHSKKCKKAQASPFLSDLTCPGCHAATESFRRTSEKIEQADEENLMRLLKVRRCLWT